MLLCQALYADTFTRIIGRSVKSVHDLFHRQDHLISCRTQHNTSLGLSISLSVD